MYTASADGKRRDRQSLAHIQTAGSLRSKQTFVTGEAQHINSHRLNINRNRSCRLRGVHNQQCTRTAGNLRNPCQIIDISRHIGRVLNDNRPRVLSYLFRQTRGIDHAVLIRRHNRERHAPAFLSNQRTQNRIVFADRGDHMIARLNQSFHRGVQRLRRVGRECNTCRLFRMKQFRQLFPRPVHRSGCLQCRVVCAPSRVADAVKRAADRLFYLRRFQKRGCRTVQIDHGFTIRDACVIFSAMTYILVTVPT